MNTTYFPILKALAAELTALEKTKPVNASRMIPLFEIPKVPDRKKYRESRIPKAGFIDDTSKEVGRLWARRYAMFDTFQWNPAEIVETGEHVIPYTYNAINSLGVHAIPVVGYDRWAVQDYQRALKSISRIHPERFCIRLDHTAFEDSAEPDFFKENLDDILTFLEIDPVNCHVFLDFEDITPLSLIALFSKFDSLFTLISRYRFMSYSIAGCSLPKSIEQAVKTRNSCSSVLRKELLLWKNVRQQYARFPVYFGDYGIRGPNTSERGFGNTNGKIRYTIDSEYFVARGQSLSLPPKGQQMWTLSQAIIDSGHYTGPEFSWGDAEIVRCSKKEFIGNSGAWVSIDTNHHMAYVVAEIDEFERANAARIARTK